MGNYKFAVVLSGSGVFDGAEIHEATLTMYAIMKNGSEYQVFAPEDIQKSYPNVIKKINTERIFPKNLPEALLKLIGLPSISTILIPKALLPKVACFFEDSREAKYNHEIGIPITLRTCSSKFTPPAAIILITITLIKSIIILSNQNAKNLLQKLA